MYPRRTLGDIVDPDEQRTLQVTLGENDVVHLDGNDDGKMWFTNSLIRFALTLGSSAPARYDATVVSRWVTASF